jgi:CRP-like cAMP-binding protein
MGVTIDRYSVPRSAALPPVAAAPLTGPARVVRRGEALYDVGDRADTVYQVESGLLALCLPLPSGHERIVALAGPGEYVGALAPDTHEHDERAEALSPTVTAVGMPRDGVDATVEGALFRTVASQVTRLRRALEEAHRPVPIRLALALLDLGARYGVAAEGGTTRLTLPLTHEHLAGMVGAARETTSAAMADLRRLGLVEGTRGRYRFSERALERYAAGESSTPFGAS